jgi:hypothetical protein
MKINSGHERHPGNVDAFQGAGELRASAPVGSLHESVSPTPKEFSESPLAKTSLSPAAQLGDWRSEFDVEDRVRHCDGLIGRGAIPFFERDFVCYRVTE